MKSEALPQLTDEQLKELMSKAQALLKERAEQRRQEAMEQIRQIAASAKLRVTFTERGRARHARTPMRAGERYQNPADPSQVYEITKGPPPPWFVTLRDMGRLPAPVKA